MSSTIFNDVVAGHAPGPLSFTVEQFHKMLDDGILAEGQPVELIDGVVMPKNRASRGDQSMVHGRRHSVAIVQIQETLGHHFRLCDCHVRSQLPVTLSEISEPEPDVALVTGAAARYLDHHPGPSEVFLAVEVAESSLSYDRNTKHRLYAEAGITAYWIVNLVDDEVEVYELPEPAHRRYSRKTRYTRGDRLTQAFACGNPLDLLADQLIPPRL